MFETSQPSKHATLILFSAGLLSILFGLALIVERFTFASLFFGMGFPNANLDELKVTFIECGGIFAITQGAILFAAGLFLAARNGAGREVVARPTSH
jgi:hypothetical protein